MKRKKKYFLFVPAIIVYLFFIYSSCSNNPVEPPPPPEEQYVKLSTITVSCTEAFIKVSVNDTLLPLNITINRDDNSVFNFNLTKSDTIIIDTNLAPGSSYNYNAEAIIKSKEWVGKKLQVQTLVLSSHNYTWQKYTFGDGASSILRDVAILDENNIWVVGTVFLNDSLGNNDSQPYSVVRWDGEKWSSKKLFYNSNIIINRASGILVLNANDIYIASGSIFHWDGVSSSAQLVYSRLSLPDPNATIEKLWGDQDSTLYGVGNVGTIVFYNGSSWQAIESGTDLNIHDINGFINPFTGKTEILCVADDPYHQQPVQVIKINENNTSELLDNSGLGIAIGSVWFYPGVRYYIVGNGLYEKKYKDLIWTDLNHNRIITQYFMESIRGSSLNNIIVAGAFGEIIHFNGIRWVSIKDAETTLNYGSYYRVAVKGNIVVAVGLDGNQAVILLGNQQ